MVKVSSRPPSAKQAGGGAVSIADLGPVRASSALREALAGAFACTSVTVPSSIEASAPSVQQLQRLGVAVSRYLEVAEDELDAFGELLRRAEAQRLWLEVERDDGFPGRRADFPAPPAPEESGDRCAALPDPPQRKEPSHVA